MLLASGEAAAPGQLRVDGANRIVFERTHEPPVDARGVTCHTAGPYRASALADARQSARRGAPGHGAVLDDVERVGDEAPRHEGENRLGC
jgi:hypothetical protein